MCGVIRGLLLNSHELEMNVCVGWDDIGLLHTKTLSDCYPVSAVLT